MDRPNISTEHQPKGAGRNPSDTLDRPETARETVGQPVGRSRAALGPPDVIDEKGRPITGNGFLKK
jgi:hypothetical protein